MRRTGRTVLVLMLVVVLPLSGCTGGPVVERATPAGIHPNADRLVAQNVSEHWANETVQVGDFEQELRLSNSRTVALLETDATDADVPLALLVVSTPQVKAGEDVALNPLGRIPPDELSDAVLGASFENVSSDGTRNRTLLGSAATIHRFTAVVSTGENGGTAAAETSGRDETVAVHVVRVTHGDDYLIYLAMHPADADATPAVDRAFAAVDHRPAAADWSVDPDRATANESYA